MKEFEEYKNKVNEAIKKVQEAHDSFNDIYHENQEFEKAVILPNKGRLSDEQKQLEQELLDRLRDAIAEEEQAINELSNL